MLRPLQMEENVKAIKITGAEKNTKYRVVLRRGNVSEANVRALSVICLMNYGFKMS